jgi:chitinase
MKKRTILLALVILITFTGGIFTGVLYSKSKTEQASKPLKIDRNP